MNVSIRQVQIVLLECPCGQPCRLRPPLGDLAERLRREVQFGRDCDRRPIDLNSVDGDMATTFHTCRAEN